MNALKAYLTNLNVRERWTLGIGAAVTGGYLFYLLVYSPLTSAVRLHSQQWLEKKETLVWMEKVHQQYKAKKPAQKLSSGKMLAVLADDLNANTLKRFPYQLQQVGANDIQLLFDQVPYTTFMTWLWSLSEKYDFSIKQLNMEHTATPGMVKVMLIVK